MMKGIILSLVFGISFFSAERSYAAREAFPPPEVIQDTWENQGRSPGEQFRKDAILWFHTLFPQQESAYKAFFSNSELEKDRSTRNFLKRLIVLLAMKGVRLTSQKNGKELTESPHNLASLLSHGGRILITLRGVKWNTKQFVNYLVSGDPNHNPKMFQRRPAASHGLKYNPGEDRYFEEKLGVLQTPRNLVYGLTGHHLGLDFAMGGVGAPLDGNVMGPQGQLYDKRGTASGLYLGHIYMFVTDTPRRKTGGESRSALLVGFERSGPGKTNAWGETHGIKSGFHDSSEKRGLTGGDKWSLLKVPLNPNQYGGKRIELTPKDLFYLEHYLQEFEKLPEKLKQEYYWEILRDPQMEKVVFSR